MQPNDARILRGAAIPTGLTGLAAIVAGLVLAGGKGALGSAIGVAVVLVFFTVGVLTVSHVAKKSPPLLVMAGMLSYLVKLVAVLALVVSLRDVTIWDTRAFGWTVIALTLVWLAGEANAALGAKTPHIEPASSSSDQGKPGT